MKILRGLGVGIFSLMALTSISLMFYGDRLGGGIQAAIYGAIAYWCYQPFSKKSRLNRQRIAELNAQAVADRTEIITSIENGEKPIVKVRAVILRNDEVAHFSAEGILMENKITGYSAGTTSVRMKVTKSISVGTSGTKGKAERGLVPVSNGEFALTSNRAVFAGEIKSFEVPYSKLTSYNSIDDGMIFHVGSRSYMVCLPRPDIPLINSLLRALVRK